MWGQHDHHVSYIIVLFSRLHILTSIEAAFKATLLIHRLVMKRAVERVALPRTSIIITHRSDETEMALNSLAE